MISDFCEAINKRKYKQVKNIIVFPGSFDPITRGHEAIVLRACDLFDELIVAIGHNPEKKTMFSIEKRKRWIKEVFEDFPNVKVDSYSGLTIDYCKKIGAKYLLRGLRTSADFEFERSVALVNRKLEDDIETLFLLATAEFSSYNSSIVREIIKYKGNPRQFLPEKINQYF